MTATISITSLLEHVTSTLDKQSDQVLQEQLGIGLAQFKILNVLATEPSLTQRAIANALGQTEASISRQVGLLLELGLLRSVRSAEDHRQHLTVVAPKGARLSAAARVVLERYHRPTVAALSEKQQEQLVAILEILHRQICAVTHSGPTSAHSPE